MPPPVDVASLLVACRQALADVSSTLIVTPSVLDAVEQCRPLLSAALRRSLTRLGLDQLLGAVQQRTADRIVRLLERVVDELEQWASAPTDW